MTATNGSTLTDSRGRKYIDFVMGWCVGNFGWRSAETIKALERFNGPDYIYPGYSYAPWTELARLLVSLAPRPLTTCLLAAAKRFDEAEPLLIAAAEAREKRLGPSHANTKASHADVAKLYDAWGKPDKAAQWRQRASRNSG